MKIFKLLTFFNQFVFFLHSMCFKKKNYYAHQITFISGHVHLYVSYSQILTRYNCVNAIRENCKMQFVSQP